MKFKYLIATLGMIGLSALAVKRYNEIILNDKDFKKANWGLYQNENGIIWDEWNGEGNNASHYMGPGNKSRFEYAVEKVNNGKLTGNIWVPDLNNNDSIDYKSNKKIERTIESIKPKEWTSGEELFKNIK